MHVSCVYVHTYCVCSCMYVFVSACVPPSLLMYTFATLLGELFRSATLSCTTWPCSLSRLEGKCRIWPPHLRWVGGFVEMGGRGCWDGWTRLLRWVDGPAEVGGWACWGRWVGLLRFAGGAAKMDGWAAEVGGWGCWGGWAGLLRTILLGVELELSCQMLECTYLHGPGYVCSISMLILQWVHSIVMHCTWLMYFRPVFTTSAQCHASLLRRFITDASHGKLLWWLSQKG